MTVTLLGTRAHPAKDRIAIDGKPLRRAEPHVYYALNKPTAVVTTLSDPLGRPNIRDLTRKIRQRVFPVGRLDYNSSGLLLLTNDGDLAMRLSHPRYEVPKIYHVKVSGHPDARALQRLRQGIRLEEGKTAPAVVRVIEESEHKSWLEIEIAEGKKHQIRRMCDAVGLPVEKLTRMAIGPLKLGKLPVGKFRPLTDRELAMLWGAVGVGGAGG
jgi:23S rRNA pseudouridine2605 synthase